MTRRLLVALSITATLTAAVVDAQPPSGFRGRGGFGRSGFWRLLDNPAVQKELGLEKQQLEFLGDLQTDLSEQRRGAFPRGGQEANRGENERAGEAERQARSERLRQEFFETMQAFTRQSEELVAVVLEPEQMNRLNEIRLQSEGTRALNRPDFVQLLGVTNEQLEEIRKIQRAGQGSRADRRRNRRTREQQQEIDADRLALLNDEQKAKWEAMKGKEFNFPRGSFGNRRFRGQSRGAPR